MPQLDTAKAFGLTDHPFSPNRPIPGMTKPKLLDNLVAGPLRIWQDESLLKLYCPDAGPFASQFRDFTTLLSLKGYTEKPTSVGYQSLAFFVGGPDGTGKTSLVNRMVSHLRKCRQTDAGNYWDWKVFDTWSNRPFNAENQVTALSALRDEINGQTKENDYCCLVLDNLGSETVPGAIELFSRLNETRVVFLFLISSEDKLVAKDWDNFQVSVNVYRTEALESGEAIKYVRHRLDFYRVRSANDEPILPGCPTFPFDPKDLEEAIQPPQAEERGIVTLRELNSHLSKAMQQRLLQLNETYDVQQLAEPDLAKSLIWLSRNSFERMAN